MPAARVAAVTLLLLRNADIVGANAMVTDGGVTHPEERVAPPGPLLQELRLRIELSGDQPLPRVPYLTTGSNVARVQLGARTLRVTALGDAAGPWEASDSAGM